MFCSNCYQSFRPISEPKCPTCGFYISSGQPVRSQNTPGEQSPNDGGPHEGALMDAGVRRGLKLVLIAIAFLPVYKVLAWLYPARDSLVSGSRSVELFEKGGQAILIFLFVAGMLRVLYAVTIERKRDMRAASQ